MDTIQDLLQECFQTNTKEELDLVHKMALNGFLDMGKVWEKVLGKHLSLDTRAWRDFSDLTNAKFATVSTITNHYTKDTYQASINGKNAIGHLRVCIWDKADPKGKLWYLLIPRVEYMYRGKSPIKITFWHDHTPKGNYIYAKYGCGFQEVCKGVDSTQAQLVYEGRLQKRSSAECHMA